jgi:hypothetical protein
VVELPDEEPAPAPLPVESPVDEGPDVGNAPPSRFVPPPAAPGTAPLPIPVPPPKEMLAWATLIIALFKEKTLLVAAAAPP